MDVDVLALQPFDRLRRAVDERRDVLAPERVDRGTCRTNHLQAPRVNLLERNLPCHRRLSQCRDGWVTAREPVDSFDRHQRGVNIEENDAKLRLPRAGGQAAAPCCTTFSTSANRSR